MDVFSDESSQKGHRFLVIGTLAVLQDHTERLSNELAAIRTKYAHDREMGWTCVSKYKYQTYCEWLDVFERYAKSKRVRMTALIMDTHEPKNRRWHTGDQELGFTKVMYHLLLHRVGKKYGFSRRPIYCQLDSRTTQHDPEDLRRMLNASLANKWGIKTNPFRRVVFTDSKKSDLIQLVDLVIGGLAFDKNAHGAREGTRKEKIELSQRIVTMQAIPAVQSQFNLWNWEYQDRSIPRA